MEKRIKYVPFGLLIISLTKSLIVGVGLSDVLLSAVLSSLTAFYELKLKNQDIAKLQTQLNGLKEHNIIQDKYIDDIKNSIVSVKVSSGLRGLTK